MEGSIPTNVKSFFLSACFVDLLLGNCGASREVTGKLVIGYWEIAYWETGYLLICL